MDRPAQGLDPKTVGARIRARRTELGLTLKNVADRTHLSKSFLSQVEIGKVWPSVGALDQISTVLNTPAWVFVAVEGEFPADTTPRGGAVSARQEEEPDPTVRETEIGRRLRTARKQRRYSLQHIADRAGLSKSFISQVELGQSAASLGTLKRICAVLDIPVWALLDDEPPAEPRAGGEASAPSEGVSIVRRDERKVRRYPGSNIDISLLTPDLNRKIEVTLSVLQPGEGYGHETYTHRGEEFGLVLSGIYEVTVEGEAHVLEEGDTIYFPSRLLHRTRAVGDRPVTTLWVVTPPS